jgi:hypothetical protein
VEGGCQESNKTPRIVPTESALPLDEEKGIVIFVTGRQDIVVFDE